LVSFLFWFGLGKRTSLPLQGVRSDSFCIRASTLHGRGASTIKESLDQTLLLGIRLRFRRRMRTTFAVKADNWVRLGKMIAKRTANEPATAGEDYNFLF
jgi:hypothetical protein